MFCCGQAKPLLDGKQVKEIVDPRLKEQYDPNEIMLAMATASMCIHHMSSKRPYMNQVTIFILFFFSLSLWYLIIDIIPSFVGKTFVERG
jgi:hypothetical protein